MIIFKELIAIFSAELKENLIRLPFGSLYRHFSLMGHRIILQRRATDK
jgi:hypothetical protein